MKIISRKEARALGLKTYFTGKPCKHGNLAERGVVSPYCLCRACRDERNGRGRQWRAENPEKQAAACQSWAERNPEKQLAVWRRAEESKKTRAQTDPDFKEKRAAQARAHSLANHYRYYNIDQEYTDKVKAKAADQKARRTRAKKKTELTEQETLQIRAIYRLRYVLSRETGVAYHVDHRIPLSRGGLHHPKNLWVIPAEDNLRKGAKLPNELAA